MGFPALANVPRQNRQQSQGSLTAPRHLTVDGHFPRTLRFIPHQSAQQMMTLVRLVHKQRCRTKAPTGSLGRQKRSIMRMILTAALAIAPLALMPLPAKDNDTVKRLNEASAVFSEIMATPDKGIPQDMLANAHCIVIVPGLKTGAFVLGGKYGKGYLACRNKNGVGWSAPGTVRIEGGSVGFQIGGSQTDLIMLVMTERGADKLLSSKFTLGAEGSVAAGPVGRTATAQTDAQMHAEILSWSRSQGLFAGLALEGATLRQDLDDNAELYGSKIANREIVTSGMHAPEEAARLMHLLSKYSWREGREVTSGRGSSADAPSQ